MISIEREGALPPKDQLPGTDDVGVSHEFSVRPTIERMCFLHPTGSTTFTHGPEGSRLRKDTTLWLCICEGPNESQSYCYLF